MSIDISWVVNRRETRPERARSTGNRGDRFDAVFSGTVFAGRTARGGEPRPTSRERQRAAVGRRAPWCSGKWLSAWPADHRAPACRAANASDPSDDLVAPNRQR